MHTHSCALFALFLTVQAIAVPLAPAGVGFEAVADPPVGVVAYVDAGATNTRSDPCHATLDTNAGVRVVAGFLDIWQPRSLFVDAGNSISASGSCPAVVASDWSGIPGSDTDGHVLNEAVHAHNIQYVVDKTQARTAAGELAAYLDDRRNKGYSVIDGLGPLTSAWVAGTKQTTTITSIPSDAATKQYSDSGNNIGVGSTSNADLGLAVDFVNAMSGDSASTEPAKRFFKYARPFRWSSDVVLAPSLVMVKSTTPKTDSGYISGHSAEAWRDVIGMAYLVPERFQELLTRAMELGDNRMLAGYHSPLDVMSGRIQAIAVATYNLNRSGVVALGASARAQVLSWLEAQVGVSSEEALLAYAHTAAISADRFADYSTNKAFFRKVMTNAFPQIADTTKDAVVPKGAELLLATRLPYLTGAQRRVVLKSTAFPSGYPIMDDAEGWGRLDLFAAADGYGSFEADVYLNMDGSLGGFSASDTWKNNIDGAGKLVKQGSGTLHLTGINSYSGGTELREGAIVAESSWALGSGDAYVSGGVLRVAAPQGLGIPGKLSLLSGAALEIQVTASPRAIEVGGAAFIDGATLHISFPGSYAPVLGDWIAVIAANSLQGKFASIVVDGFENAKAIYSDSGLMIHLLPKYSFSDPEVPVFPFASVTGDITLNAGNPIRMSSGEALQQGCNGASSEYLADDGTWQSSYVDSNGQTRSQIDTFYATGSNLNARTVQSWQSSLYELLSGRTVRISITCNNGVAGALLFKIAESA